MLLLAFDTSTSQGGVAVFQDSHLKARHVWSREGSHGELLTPAIEKALNEAGVQASQLDAVAIGRGPGSFTGARIAVNAARSLAYALGKPVYAFDTDVVLVESVQRYDLPVLVIINAQKNLLFTSTFQRRGDGWTKGLSLEALTPEEIAAKITTPHLCLGDGYNEYASIFTPELQKCLVRDSAVSDFPLPEAVGNLALKPNASPLDWKEVQALYIRASGAEEKLKKG